MRFAFCIFKYFPFGGIQRDGFRIAQTLVERGHSVRFYAISWSGEVPAGTEFVPVPVRAVTRHALYDRFQDWVQEHLQTEPVDLVFGLNKMEGLDAYFAGDSCFEEKARTQRGWWYRQMPRYRFFAATEKAVFRRLGATEVLTISDVQTPMFQRYYRTPNERLHALPPGIDPSRIAPVDAAEIGAKLRREFGVGQDERLLLFVGSGFKKKGLDRVLRALANLPSELAANTRLFVLGADNFDPFERMAKRLGVFDKLRFFAGRDDVPRFFFAADVLLLPAYDENTGTVILESMVAGLPVLTTQNCGYAVWVERFQAGRVVPEPFDQDRLDADLVALLTTDDLPAMASAAASVAQHKEIFSLVPTAAGLLERFAHRRRNGIIVFCLFKYFPFGGLQRDLLRIATRVAAEGFAVRVYTLSWEGAVPPEFDVVLVPDRGLVNHVRYKNYVEWLSAELKRTRVALVVGFNKMPGLDMYFAADSCFETKARTLRGSLYRYTPRYRFFAAAERAVFSAQARTQIMLLTDAQRAEFHTFYGTPAERMTVLPPGVGRDRLPPTDTREIRAELRAEFDIGEDELLLLSVGSGFATKGLDRSLRAIAELPADLRSRVKLLVIGQDDASIYQRLAQRLDIADRTWFLSGRDDVSRFLQSADVLLHPAYAESGGIVLLEALISGLPVLATQVCGYSTYIADAQAGVLLAEPFSDRAYVQQLSDLLTDQEGRKQMGLNGLEFGRDADIFDLPRGAASLIVQAAKKGERAGARLRGRML